MFVGYYLDKQSSSLYVSERIQGKRFINNYPLVLEYYVPDENGYYMGYDGNRLRKITCNTYREFQQHRFRINESGDKTYELNFNLPNKVLYKHYKQGETPKLNISFCDIEVDRKGFESLTVKELIEKACCPINAISIYNDWQETLYTLMLKPETLTKEEAGTICKKFDNTFLFDDETKLLQGVITLLDDTDCFCGWNSSRFDTPYIVRRIENVLGITHTEDLCLFGQKPIFKEKRGEFGDVNIEYEIPGKWFTDYMVLYIKHEQGKKESHSLNYIASIELGEEKVKHTESLEDMYRNRYEDFIKYNRQDTMLVKRLEDKLQYIAIHNEQAHDIRCSLESTMGTVAWVDQAMINEAHDADLMINDKDEMKNNDFLGIVPPGAFVPTPKPGLADWIVSYDMNSLYPTTMRSLNLSPEMIVAQVKMTLTIPRLWEKIRTHGLWKNISKQIPDWGAAWAGDDMWGTLEYQEIMNKTNQILTVKFDTGEEVEISAKELYDMIFAEGSNLAISGAGTIFKTEKKGLLNKIFTRWYAERKGFKKEMVKYERMSEGVKIDDELVQQLM